MTTGFDDYLRRIEEIKREATLAERERITAWIEENRSALEFEPGEVIYRDHFTSESLLTFINGENK